MLLSMSDSIPIDRWGKDHWALLAYIESVCVDQHGMVDLKRMRCDADRHPQYIYLRGIGDELYGKKKYPTQLKDGEQPDHDDWDCLDDLETAGLVENIGFTMQPRYIMTDRGHEVASELRKHKAQGGRYKEFAPSTGELR